MENNKWNEVSKPFDEYVYELISHKNKNSFHVNENDDGMIEISDSFELKKHAIVFNDELIFPHALLRRNGRDNFVNINSLLSRFVNNDYKVTIRLDPFKKSLKSEYQEIIEMSTWYGPDFSNSILTTAQKFTPSIKFTNVESDEITMLTYPVKYTIFRPSWLDKKLNIIQFYIEELLLPDSQYHGFGSEPYTGEEFVAQKFVHFAFDRNENSFAHIDGAIRIFRKNEYEELFSTVQKGKIYNQHIPGVKRYKLFKVEGKLTLDDISLILSDYLMYNPLIKEYFE
ncbi:hypothetical protein [Leuconostoc mesenteroides]|uniref:hypothetical protein n=1 Tax=Leuconostoc mesenteroides TaxID=1245 RepID=UPI00236082DA|nr:hypothetical protein [Leuconostoc mesenteroides]